MDDAKLLRHQLAGEAAGVLHDDSAHAIALDPIKQRREAARASIGSVPRTAASAAVGK
jgi:hypothetical protein